MLLTANSFLSERTGVGAALVEEADTTVTGPSARLS